MSRKPGEKRVRPNRKRWARTSQGTKGTLPINKLMKAVRAPDLKTSAMTIQDKLEALELYADLGNVAAVAAKMNRSPDALNKFLCRYRSTTKSARLTLEAGSDILAKRIIKDADVDQALEVMDRLDILNEKRDKSAPATTSVLVIGMPNHPNLDQMVPVPSQKQIDRAIDAQVVDSK